MQSSASAVLLAFATLAQANFYMIQGEYAIPPQCVGDTGCIPEPGQVTLNVIDVAEFTNCDALGGLKPSNGYGWVDPVCPGGGKGGQPFVARGNACGQTDGYFYFRVQSQNPGQLDAATDSGFNNIVANCYKQPNCGDWGEQRCKMPSDWQAKYQCSPLNGSGC